MSSLWTNEDSEDSISPLNLIEADLCEDSGAVDVVGERSGTVLIPMSARLVPFEGVLQASASTVASSGDWKDFEVPVGVILAARKCRWGRQTLQCLLYTS